jgi:D-3-phosphoglycerate dehydrogenase
MKVLIADKVHGSLSDGLRAQGFEVLAKAAQGEELRALMSQEGPEVLVVRSTKVTAAHMDASPRLGLVVRAGAGTNTIDVGGASARGIYVANCPGRNATAVAELVFGLLLGADRQIPNSTRDLRAGLWRKKRYGEARGLLGRTLGLIGYGSTGQEVAKRAKAFGMEVVAWSRSLTEAQAKADGVRYAASPLEVARQADAVSVHVAFAPQTKGIIDAAFVEAMKPGAIFINTARGEVVDEAALLAGVRQKGLRCGLDVFEGEPSEGEAPFHSELLREEMVFGSPHVGGSTAQAEESVAALALEIILKHRFEGQVPCCVNLAVRSEATHLLAVRHRDQVGVLAAVLGVLRTAGINVQEMENIIFAGGEAAIARIRLGSEPSPATLEAVAQAQHVLAVDLLRLD